MALHFEPMNVVEQSALTTVVESLETRFACRSDAFLVWQWGFGHARTQLSRGLL
jgi:hypothetical protein